MYFVKQLYGNNGYNSSFRTVLYFLTLAKAKATYIERKPYDMLIFGSRNDKSTWKLFGLNKLNYHCGKVNCKDMLVEFCSKSIFFEGGRYHRFWIGKSYQKNAFPFTQLNTQQKEISSIEFADLNLSSGLKMLRLMELWFSRKWIHDIFSET